MTEHEVVEIALFTDQVEATRSFYERLLGTRPEAEWPGGAIFAPAASRCSSASRAARVPARSLRIPAGPAGRLVERAQT